MASHSLFGNPESRDSAQDMLAAQDMLVADPPEYEAGTAGPEDSCRVDGSFDTSLEIRNDSLVSARSENQSHEEPATSDAGSANPPALSTVSPNPTFASNDQTTDRQDGDSGASGVMVGVGRPAPVGLRLRMSSIFQPFMDDGDHDIDVQLERFRRIFGGNLQRNGGHVISPRVEEDEDHDVIDLRAERFRREIGINQITFRH